MENDPTAHSPSPSRLDGGEEKTNEDNQNNKEEFDDDEMLETKSVEGSVHSENADKKQTNVAESAPPSSYSSPRNTRYVTRSGKTFQYKFLPDTTKKGWQRKTAQPPEEFNPRAVRREIEEDSKEAKRLGRRSQWEEEIKSSIQWAHSEQERRKRNSAFDDHPETPNRNEQARRDAAARGDIYVENSDEDTGLIDFGTGKPLVDSSSTTFSSSSSSSRNPNPPTSSSSSALGSLPEVIPSSSSSAFLSASPPAPHSSLPSSASSISPSSASSSSSSSSSAPFLNRPQLPPLSFRSDSSSAPPSGRRNRDRDSDDGKQANKKQRQDDVENEEEDYVMTISDENEAEDDDNFTNQSYSDIFGKCLRLWEFQDKFLHQIQQIVAENKHFELYSKVLSDLQFCSSRSRNLYMDYQSKVEKTVNLRTNQLQKEVVARKAVEKIKEKQAKFPQLQNFDGGEQYQKKTPKQKFLIDQSPWMVAVKPKEEQARDSQLKLNWKRQQIGIILSEEDPPIYPIGSSPLYAGAIAIYFKDLKERDEAHKRIEKWLKDKADDVFHTVETLPPMKPEFRLPNFPKEGNDKILLAAFANEHLNPEIAKLSDDDIKVRFKRLQKKQGVIVVCKPKFRKAVAKQGWCVRWAGGGVSKAADNTPMFLCYGCGGWNHSKERCRTVERGQGKCVTCGSHQHIHENCRYNNGKTPDRKSVV